MVPCDSIHRDHSHDLVAEFIEESTLKGLGEKVRYHLFGGTILYGNFLSGNAVGNKKIPDVDMASAFPARGLAVFRELDCTLVVLVEDRGDAVTLCFHEVLGPECLWQNVINPDELSFSGAFSV